MTQPNNKLKVGEIYLDLTIRSLNSGLTEYLFEKYFYLPNSEMVYKAKNGKHLPIETNSDLVSLKENIYSKISTLAEKRGKPIFNSSADKRTSNRSRIFYLDDLDDGFNYESTYSHIINQSQFHDLVFDARILGHPSLVDITCQPRIKSIGGNATTDKLTEWREGNPYFAPLWRNLYWFEVIPSIDNPLRKKYHNLPDEVYLNAPYYRTEKLPSGAILLQMTEKTDFTKFDQEYWNKMIELYKYFAVHQNF